MRVIIIFIAFLFLGFGSGNLDAIIGQWENPDGTRRVEIFKSKDCYLGKIVWLKVKEPKAKPGDIIFKDIQFKNPHWNGKITLPTESRIFDMELRLVSENKLEIKASYKNMSRKKVWKRVF
ncbi:MULTISPECIES: DUF2147 domain-containing protein [unclassified Empedobacter]|uniref:DUF2147 domain-containing protein n=1 Tax=unclassified Empedobacter TaxID=2643773 RepID=UPI00244B40DA|nr:MULTISPECIES: DUF2147 domain-containing protein [unclassified Empedobacter]MDH0660062.1 DUF2147 domain-containing protein [Empedobacter sp. GD03865]MDH0675491.1 DUF2147 domain-containing protein [Empedobacter sp. GD03861]MDH1603204.1 DUF2147 domain-containing protein [Empedobacter sp. GD03739]